MKATKKRKVEKFDTELAFQELAKPAIRHMRSTLANLPNMQRDEQEAIICATGSKELGRACHALYRYAQWSYTRWRVKLAKPKSGARPVAEFPTKRKAEVYIEQNDESSVLPDVKLIVYGVEAGKVDGYFALCSRIDDFLEGRFPEPDTRRVDKRFSIEVEHGWMYACYRSSADLVRGSFRMAIGPAADTSEFGKFWHSRPAWDGIQNELSWIGTVLSPYWQGVARARMTSADARWLEAESTYMVKE